MNIDNDRNRSSVSEVWFFFADHCFSPLGDLDGVLVSEGESVAKFLRKIKVNYARTLDCVDTNHLTVWKSQTALPDEAPSAAFNSDGWQKLRKNKKFTQDDARASDGDFVTVPMDNKAYIVIQLPSYTAEPALPIRQQRQGFLKRNSAKAPSSEATTSNFIRTQREDISAIFCGRPLHREQRIPPSLLDNILAKFRHDLKTITASAEDIAAFQDLRLELSAIFSSESERQEILIELLKDHNIVPQDLRPGRIGSYCTDGDLRKVLKGLDFLYYIQVIKNEIGKGGGDPYYEAVRYYLEQVRVLLDSDKLTEDQVKCLKFPAILLVHFGPYMCVAAAVFTTHPVVEHLACIPLHVHSTNEEELAAGERLIASLREALVDLGEFYSSVNTIDALCPSFEYPFRTFYEILIEGEMLRCLFTYDAIIEDKRVFRAHTQDDQDVIIKFSRRYCEGAHRAAYDLGIAPKLFTVNQVYGWFMVVMEDVSAEYTTAWDLRQKLSLAEKELIQEKTRVALTRVNGAGFVHGDVRDINVLVRRDFSSVLIIDWDWGGGEGKVVYPRNMNPEIRRPTGAGVGKLILATHDVEMASKLF